jgi:riboflavin synthase
MFTGIVEERGMVGRVEQFPSAARLTIRGPLVCSDAAPGESISVNGVCLTVVTVADGEFQADVMLESLERSSLGDLRPGGQVNLERAVTVASRLGGHLVQGHVDGVATLLHRTPEEHWHVLRFSLPAALGRYVVEKGSITIDGVSLTVSAVGEEWFEVSLIPTTLAVTTLGALPVGGTVNLEVDVIAKYVEKLLAHHRTSESS